MERVIFLDHGEYCIFTWHDILSIALNTHITINDIDIYDASPFVKFHFSRRSSFSFLYHVRREYEHGYYACKYYTDDFAIFLFFSEILMHDIR